MPKRFVFLFIVAVAVCGCSKNSGAVSSRSAPAQAPAASSQAPRNAPGELRSKVPDGWTTEKPTSDMRFAQYKLPKAEGDDQDALLVVYYFGPGQGGSAQANIDRWVEQMKQPAGSSSKDKAKTGTMTVNGLQVTTRHLLGNYSGGMSADSAPADKKAIYRLRGAIVETPKGSYFIKLTGPEKTVGHWDQAYTAYLNSLEFN